MSDVGAMTKCPKCGLEAKSLLHPFCQHSECPVREALGPIREPTAAATQLDALAIDVATNRCIGVLENSIHDPETGELNFPGTRADISREDVEAIVKTLKATLDDRVRLRRNRVT